MSKQIPWLRILVEGAVIVSSILLAFGIDAWWERRQDQQASGDYLVRLASDFETDAGTWRLQSDMVVAKLESLDGVLEWVRSPDRTQQAVDELVKDLVTGGNMSFGGPAMNPLRSTFDELISTGSLQLLSPRLRRSLLDYYRLTDFRRAQLVGRENEYHPTVSALVPRAGSSAVRGDLPPSERQRIAERALSEDLEGLVIAERNRAQLHREAAADLLARALDVLSEIELEGR